MSMTDTVFGDMILVPKPPDVNERYCLALAIASAGNSSPTLGSSSKNGAWHKATT